MMSVLHRCLVSLLLIPCLVADPATAACTQPSIPPRNVKSVGLKSIGTDAFLREAFQERLLSARNSLLKRLRVSPTFRSLFLARLGIGGQTPDPFPIQEPLEEAFEERMERSARVFLPYEPLLTAVNILLHHENAAPLKKLWVNLRASRNEVRVEGETLKLSFRAPQRMETLEALQFFQHSLGWDLASAVQRLKGEAPHLLLSSANFKDINLVLRGRMAGLGDLVFMINTAQVLHDTFPQKKVRIFFHSSKDVELVRETKLMKELKAPLPWQKTDGVEVIDVQQYKIRSQNIEGRSPIPPWEDIIEENDVAIVYALGGDEKEVYRELDDYDRLMGRAHTKIYIYEIGMGSHFQNPKALGYGHLGFGHDEIGLPPVSPVSLQISVRKYQKSQEDILRTRKVILKKIPSWTLLDSVVGQVDLQRTVASEWGFLYTHQARTAETYFKLLEIARQKDPEFRAEDKTIFVLCGRKDQRLQKMVREAAVMYDYNLLVYENTGRHLERVRESESKSRNVTVIMDSSVPRKLFGELFIYSDDLPTVVSGQDNLANIVHLNQRFSGRHFFWEALPFQGGFHADLLDFVGKNSSEADAKRLQALWSPSPSEEVEASRMFSSPDEHREFFKRISATLSKHVSFLPQLYYLILQGGRSANEKITMERADDWIRKLRGTDGPDRRRPPGMRWTAVSA